MHICFSICLLACFTLQSFVCFVGHCHKAPLQELQCCSQIHDGTILTCIAVKYTTASAAQLTISIKIQPYRQLARGSCCIAAKHFTAGHFTAASFYGHNFVAQLKHALTQISLLLTSGGLTDVGYSIPPTAPCSEKGNG